MTPAHCFACGSALAQGHCPRCDVDVPDGGPPACSRCAEMEQWKRETARWKSELERANDQLHGLVQAQRAVIGDHAHCAEERERLQARVQELEEKMSDIVLKHGGTNAGYAYGPANCSSCGQLSNDYYLVGQGQLCLECHGQFPAQIAERDALRAEVERLKAQRERDVKATDQGSFAYDSMIARLREQLATARAALADAVDTIHGEFCGSDQHHTVCEKPRQALATLDAGKEGGE